MSYISGDDIMDDNDSVESNDSISSNDQDEANSAKVRKRIDDLLEKKRLKELLDDTDDW